MNSGAAGAVRGWCRKSGREARGTHRAEGGGSSPKPCFESINTKYNIFVSTRSINTKSFYIPVSLAFNGINGGDRNFSSY